MRPLKTTVMALAATLCTALYSQDYEVKVTRSRKPGESAVVKGTGTKSVDFTAVVDGKVIQRTQTSFAATFNGTSTVVTVDKDGEPTEIRTVVESCTRTDKGQGTAKAAVARGAVVVAKLIDGEEVLTVDGKKPTEDVKDVLELFIGVSENGGLKDQTVIGPKGRKKVGDSWNIDADAAAKDLASIDLLLDPKDAKGLVKLEKVATVKGVDCMFLSVDFHAKNLRPKDAMEEGEEIKAFEAKGTRGLILPLNVSKIGGGSEGRFDMEITMSSKVGEDNTEMVTTMKMHYSSKIELTEVTPTR